MLEIRLFGSLSLRRDGRRLPPFATRKAEEVFTFLALHRHRRYLRLVLAGLLWGDCEEAQARKLLRNSLWRVRKGLGVSAGDRSDCPLYTDNQLIGFRLTEQTWLDVAEFEERLGQWAVNLEIPLTSAMRWTLEDAVALYRGELLEGCYEEWCLRLREQLHQRFLEATEALMADHEARGELQQAIFRGQCLLEHDPLLERVYRRLMRCYHALGNRAAALQQFDLCRRCLGRDLAIEPLPETVSLMRAIRDGGAGRLHPSGGPPPGLLRPVPAATAADPVQDQLRILERLLDEARDRLVSLRRFAGSGR